jgi:hypothetical protein
VSVIMATTNANARVSVLLDRIQVASEAPTPPTPPVIPQWKLVSDHLVRPQTDIPTYARCREYMGAGNHAKIFWQYERRCPWLKPWKITLIADDRLGLSATDVWSVVRYCRSYQVLIVELAFDFSTSSSVNQTFVRRHGVFGKSRRHG